MKPTVEVNGTEIVIRLHTVEQTAAVADRLVRVDGPSLRREGLELSAVRALIRSGEIPSRKIGRCVYVCLSDLIALVKQSPRPESTTVPKAAPTADADYLSLVAQARRRAR